MGVESKIRELMEGAANRPLDKQTGDATAPTQGSSDANPEMQDLSGAGNKEGGLTSEVGKAASGKASKDSTLPKGQGAVFTAQLKGGFEAGVKLVESVNLFSHLANVGDARSLVLHPASTTHRQLTPEQRSSAGAGDDIVRLSIGLETVEDLVRDLDQALST